MVAGSALISGGVSRLVSIVTVACVGGVSRSLWN